MMVRAFFCATKVTTAHSPYDTLTLKVYYPARLSGSEVEQNTGVVPANDELAPFPVVIMMSGINVEPAAYHWLAMALAQKGVAVVTYSWVAEEMPGFVSLTPGVDLTAVSPQTYGTKPTCPAIQPILDTLAQLQTDGILAGKLDLDTIILGGHSAGGTMALQNANPDWFAQVKGCFSYAGHTMASTFLGYDAGTILPISDQLPHLILGGTEDGVIEASAHRYQLENASATLALERTFDEAIATEQNHSYLVIIKGANHFSFVYPLDESTGRPFLDHPTTEPDEQIRNQLIHIITFFIQGHIVGDPKMKIVLKQNIGSGNPLIAMSKFK